MQVPLDEAMMWKGERRKSWRSPRATKCVLHLVIFTVTTIFWIDNYLQVLHLLFRKKKKVWLFPAIALNSHFLPRVTVCLPCFQGTLFCLFLMAQIIIIKKKISRQRTVPSVFCLGVRRHYLENGTDHMLKGEDINHLLRTSKMKCEGKHEKGKRSF